MTVFACPVCGERLEQREKTYQCPKGHSYDIASEGYVHLLRPDEKHSKMPGDDKNMVASRRRFLEGGYYDSFSDCLNELARQYAGDGKVFLDAGCGEGFYTGRMQSFFPGNMSFYGFDISKFAVRSAAQKYKEISFAVGSMFHIPVVSGAADCAFNVFAPIVPDELCRVLRPGGILILAVPGERHLFGLKEVLYDSPYENEHRETEYPGFAFLDRVPVRGEISVEGNRNIFDLFAMTPYYWKTPREGSERLRRLERLKTEIGFDFLLYRKVGKE